MADALEDMSNAGANRAQQVAWFTRNAQSIGSDCGSLRGSRSKVRVIKRRLQRCCLKISIAPPRATVSPFQPRERASSVVGLTEASQPPLRFAVVYQSATITVLPVENSLSGRTGSHPRCCVWLKFLDTPRIGRPVFRRSPARWWHQLAACSVDRIQCSPFVDLFRQPLYNSRMCLR